ncbi:MAG TPA: autotransporter domain-containing protein [Lacunisphaera sp.]|nr:autotransporter domain-containing protein [Lacunisphaera sp.]
MNNKHLVPLSLMALVALACAPVSGFAQSILQTAGNYALLGGTLISVGGPGPNSIVNGNVGLWSAATSNITGFPPATVSGITAGGSTAAIIATGPLTTGQAYADVQKAHVGLAGMASSVNVSNVDLGTMAPLFSGVYTFNGAATQTGALILDAQGHNGVTWVFQIGTSLTTAVNSTVTFINLGTNGGRDLGVFWNAGAGITIGDKNTILGNYIAGTSISFTGSTSTAGAGGARALALAAITFAGPGAINALGGPGGGDFSGGLAYDANGAVVTVTNSGGGATPPPSGNTGSVLVSGTGVVTPGTSGPVPVQGSPLGTTTATIDGNIADGSAPASLNVTTATVTLTGTNTYTGGTTVTGGTLIAGSANLPANQGVVLASSGSLIFNQPVDGSFGGVISGNGSVTKQGAGALTVTAANTYTGGTVVNAGSLVATTATLPAGQAVAVNGSGVLVFNQTTDGTFGGIITGGGVVRKQGGGRLTLTQPTTSPVDLRAGALFSDASIGTTTIAAGGFLGGNVTVAGNLVNSGTVSPGNSPGTITVTGNYTQTATGTLVIELASGASFDHLTIAGSAVLAGTLQVDLLGGFNPLGQSFTFLTASGGVSGAFTNLTGNAINTQGAATATKVTYAATSVNVAFVQLPFAGFAQTPNQAAVANAAQASPALTVALDAVPRADQFPAAFNALSPQGYAVWSDIAFAGATALTDRLIRDNGATPGHDNYYFDASQRRGNRRSDGDVGSSTFTTTSGLVGVDRAFDATVTTGLFFNYGETVAGLGRPGSRSSVKAKLVGFHAAWTHDQWFAHAAYGYGWDRYSSTRPVVFPGVAAVADSRTTGHHWFLDYSAGRELVLHAVSVSPYVGVLLGGWRAHGFTETGAGSFDNRVGDQAARSLRSQVGVQAQLNWEFGSLTLQPHVRAAWLREFAHGARDMHAALDGVDYVVVTRAPQRNIGQFSAGVNLVFNPRALLYAELTTQGGGTTRNYTDWRVGASIRF